MSWEPPFGQKAIAKILKCLKLPEPFAFQGLKKMTNALVALLLFSSTVPLTISIFTVHYTSSGGLCTGTCGFHGYDYTWCEQSGGNGKKWDYCSLEPGLNAEGQRCGTPCLLWGGSYRYCYLINGKWHYCGLLGQLELLQYSQSNEICFNACRATNSSFQCNTNKGVERCSPFRDVTPTGLPCSRHYRCAKYGYSVYRCHTDDIQVQWDECGRNSLDNCVWFVNTSVTAQHFEVPTTEFCRLSDLQSENHVIFRREKRKPMLNYFFNTQFSNAVHLIDDIDSITDLPDAGLSASMYLSKQESIFCKGVNYTNVELRWRVHNENSVPVAHVLYPENLYSVEILRLAFYTSLHSSYYLPPYTIVVSVGKAMLCSIE